MGWLVCLGKREFPVDPHRDPRAEKSGAETVEQSIPTGVEIPQQTRFHSIESPRKAALSNLHTHEATGSSPVVSTKNHRNRSIPVIFFHNPQLFGMLNFCRFSKTHTLAHTGKGTESTGPVFFQRIC